MAKSFFVFNHPYVHPVKYKSNFLPIKKIDNPLQEICEDCHKLLPDVLFFDALEILVEYGVDGLRTFAIIEALAGDNIHRYIEIVQYGVKVLEVTQGRQHEYKY